MRLVRKLTVIAFALSATACSVESDESASAINWDNMDFAEVHCAHSDDPSCAKGGIATDRILGSRGK